jgi:hypothetical protein
MNVSSEEIQFIIWKKLNDRLLQGWPETTLYSVIAVLHCKVIPSAITHIRREASGILIKNCVAISFDDRFPLHYELFNSINIKNI